MSENDSGSERSSASSKANLGLRKSQGGVIAKTALSRMAPDYDKMRTREALKVALQERDQELKTLAMDYNARGDRITALRSTVASKNREIASLKQVTKEANTRANRLTDALLGVSKSENIPVTDTVSEPVNEPVSEPQAEQAKDPKPSTSSDDKTVPKSYADDPSYQAAIKQLDLENLDLVNEANSMVQSADTSPVDGETYRYQVPTHLMGLAIGRQRVTMRRISHQTSTEIEQCSWTVEDDASTHRHMGFSILGSAEAIRNAIDAFIRVIREMELSKATKMISGHIIKPSVNTNKVSKQKDNATAKKKTPTATPKKVAGDKKTGSKSTKTKNQLCPHYVKGQCRYGVKCWNKHSLGLGK